MVDDDTLVLLGLKPSTPNETTLQIPIVPGKHMPWVDPRRYGPDGPVWDATDELYITYDEEGHRVLTTTGETAIWTQEHSYQRTGSARYEQLAGLSGGGGVGGGFGGEPGSGGGGWADASPREYPPVHVDRDGDYPGQGPRGGTGPRHQAGGDGAHGAARHARRSATRSRVPERSPGELNRIRSHRHCPGCNGHDRAERGAGGLILRALAAWIIGWGGIWAAGLGLTLPQYVILTGLGFVAATTFRPVWREWVNAEDRYAKGGRR